MLKDITIGQYVRGESFLHKMDARAKILLTVFYIVILFLADSAVSYALLGAFLLLLIFKSRVPLKFIVRGLKPMVFILVFTAAINIFMTPGEPLLQFRIGWMITITREGVITGIEMFLRLVYLVMGTSLLTLTTSPLMLTDGIEQLLKPLERFKVPAHEIAMMMTIAIRFIPTLAEETDKIMKAQTARGADFETGNIFRRAKAMIPLLVPLFISAFRRADDLAMAMDARCYHGGQNRTRMKQTQLGWRDGAGAAAMVLLLAAVMVFDKIV